MEIPSKLAIDGGNENARSQFVMEKKGIPSPMLSLIDELRVLAESLLLLKSASHGEKGTKDSRNEFISLWQFTHAKRWLGDID